MGPHEMCPMFLSDFNEAWIFFFERCEKYKQISNFMLIRPVTADLFHADGRRDRQTDIHGEANSRFSQFLRTPLKTAKSVITTARTSNFASSKLIA